MKRKEKMIMKKEEVGGVGINRREVSLPIRGN